MTRRWIPVPALLLLALAAGAQTDTASYAGEPSIRYDDWVYADRIRSVTLVKEGQVVSDAAIAFGSPERLHLGFDDLEQAVNDYSYTFIHCSSTWEPTGIPVSYYLDGPGEERITEYGYSFNTRQSYTHFGLTFPNETMQPQYSGNYILSVYETGYPDRPVLTRRWIYYEQAAAITGTVRRATVIADRDSRQEVDFAIDLGTLPVANPFEEIRVMIQQNGRWDNAIRDIRPLYIKGPVLDYDYDEGNTFNGGNEYRVVDIRAYRSPNLYMKDFLEDSTGIHAYVKDDFSRAPYRYSIEEDINGKFTIAMYDSRDASREGEYLHVHFKLLMDEAYADGTPYVFGALTDWKLLPEAKLRYDYDAQAYRGELYLKQGYYNYQYVFLRDGSPIPDETVVEGNHFETRNDYAVLVYYRAPAERHDRLVGYRQFSSKNIY